MEHTTRTDKTHGCGRESSDDHRQCGSSSKSIEKERKQNSFTKEHMGHLFKVIQRNILTQYRVNRRTLITRGKFYKKR